MNVAFFGTSNRSTHILEALNKYFNLVLCVTKPDVKVGRKQTTKETGVKTWSKKNGVSYLTINSTNAEETTKVVKALKTHNVEKGVVADFGFIIPEKIIHTFDGNLLNIHFSLLPQYRGASPVQFSILNGDKSTGITYYIVDKGLDTGPIIHQIVYKIDDKSTSGDIYNVMFKIAAKELPKVVKSYNNGYLKPKKQDNSKASYTYSKTHLKSTFIHKEDAKIDWNDSPIRIHRQIRAFYPWPIAWTNLKSLNSALKREQIFTGSSSIRVKSNLDRLLTVKIYKADLIKGQLHIKKLQVEGKSMISWGEFINGYTETSDSDD